MTDVDAQLRTGADPRSGGTGPTPITGCPVAHAPAVETEAAGCPVPHEVLAAPGCPVPHGAAVHPETASGCPFPETEVASPAAGRSTVCGYAGRGKRGYFIPGIIALLVLLGAGGLINAGALSHGSPSRLDGPYVATQIADTYQTTHRLESPPPVRCPNNEPVAVGHRFVCQLLRATGGPEPISVTETGGGQIQIAAAP